MIIQPFSIRMCIVLALTKAGSQKALSYNRCMGISLKKTSAHQKRKKPVLDTPVDSREKEISFQHKGERFRLTYSYTPGRGCPIVCLHGLLDSSKGWDSVSEAASRPVLAIDLPGFGGTTPLKGPASIQAYVDLLLKAFDRIPELDGKNYILYGHSLGGAIAAQIANDPKATRIKHLCLIAPAGFGRTPSAELFATLTQVSKNPSRKQKIKVLSAFPGLPIFSLTSAALLSNSSLVEIAYRGFVANGQRIEPELKERILEGVRGPSRSDLIEGISFAVRALAKTSKNPIDDLSGINDKLGDTLKSFVVVWGEKDRLVPVGHSKSIKRMVPESKVLVLKNIGHHPQKERPRTIHRLVNSY